MRISAFAAMTASAVLIAPAARPAEKDATVPTYHADAARSGHYIVPGLTWTNAANLKQDTAFAGQVPGKVYAQPLYWRPAGAAAGLVIVATEENAVVALDALTGRTVWRRDLGQPIKRSVVCSNIFPVVGVTGTPVIDERRLALYLDAFVNSDRGPRHLLFGLSLADGSVLPGWPVDIADSLSKIGMSFDPPAQNQRGALTLVGDRLYVPYSGHFGGGCGAEYHGWVVGLRPDGPSVFAAWRTQTSGAGVWAPGGVAYDGRYLFAATGFKFGDAEWGGQEAVIRLPLDLAWQPTPQNFYASSDWSTSGAMGAANPLPVDLPDGGPGSALLLALKTGEADLLDRNELGGIGRPLAEEKNNGGYVFSPAAYRSGRDMLVALRVDGPVCAGKLYSDAVIALRISAGPPVAMRTEWCSGVSSRGAPIATTSDDESDPIVWVVGAQGDGRLHGFRGDTGKELFTSDPLEAEANRVLQHFVTILAADGRVYVAGDGRIFAFSLPH